MSRIRRSSDSLASFTFCMLAGGIFFGLSWGLQALSGWSTGGCYMIIWFVAMITMTAILNKENYF